MKYDVWQTLTRYVEPHNVKVDVKLKNIKPLHANWIIEAYHYLRSTKNIIFFGVHKNSHNWSCKGNAFPYKCMPKPFWGSTKFVMIDYDMKNK